MHLQSEQMALSSAEKGWLPWFGKQGKLQMGWAYRRNRDRVEAMEQAFDSFAATRRLLLVEWAEQQWRLLASLAEILPAAPTAEWLQQHGPKLRDASELFVVDGEGHLLASSATSRSRREPIPPLCWSGSAAALCCMALTVTR